MVKNPNALYSRPNVRYSCIMKRHLVMFSIRISSMRWLLLLKYLADVGRFSKHKSGLTVKLFNRHCRTT